ncbi:MAG: YceI family protein [bacterium]
MRTTAATGITIRVRGYLLTAVIGLQLTVAYFVAAYSVAGAAERIFSIAPRESRMELLLYREGVFSLLAHDHVLVAAEISGTILYDNEHLEKSSLRLSIPVRGIRVDLPEDRKRLKLTGELSKGDLREIRSIMLSPRVLDAERFPTVEITSLAVGGTLGRLILDLKWRIRGVERVLSATAEVTVSGNVLRAKGEMDLFQTHFGIKPYSTLLGAIAVKDRIRIKFDLVARAVHP